MVTLKQSSKDPKKKEGREEREKKEAVETVCKNVCVKVTKACKTDQLK